VRPGAGQRAVNVSTGSPGGADSEKVVSSCALPTHCYRRHQKRLWARSASVYVVSVEDLEKASPCNPRLGRQRQP
jgi:hypothetical protein